MPKSRHKYLYCRIEIGTNGCDIGAHDLHEETSSVTILISPDRVLWTGHLFATAVSISRCSTLKLPM
jgi:hypothetical protein